MIHEGTPEAKAAQDLADAANNMAFDEDKFVDVLMNQHRTIQQNTMGAILALIWRWADQFDKGNYDARNEATCRASRQIRDALGEYGNKLPYI